MLSNRTELSKRILQREDPSELVLYSIWSADDVFGEFDEYEFSSDPDNKALGKFATENAQHLWAELASNEDLWEREFERFYEGMREVIFDFVKRKFEASKEQN